MAEIGLDIRFQGLARKEYSVDSVVISGETPVVYQTGLQLGYPRLGCYVYNNSNVGSGEVYWGGPTVSPTTGFPIPVGAVVEVPLAGELPFYFCSSGEATMDLRILEIS